VSSGDRTEQKYQYRKAEDCRCGVLDRAVPKTLPEVDMSAPVCCQPVAAGPLDDDAALKIALRLTALADPVRVKLVSMLFGSELGEE